MTACLQVVHVSACLLCNSSSRAQTSACCPQQQIQICQFSDLAVHVDRLTVCVRVCACVCVRAAADHRHQPALTAGLYFAIGSQHLCPRSSLINLTFVARCNHQSVQARKPDESHWLWTPECEACSGFSTQRSWLLLCRLKTSADWLPCNRSSRAVKHSWQS